MATAKPSRTRRQPSAKARQQREQVAKERTEKMAEMAYQKAFRRAAVAIAQQKARADALKAAGVKAEPTKSKPKRRR